MVNVFLLCTSKPFESSVFEEFLKHIDDSLVADRLESMEND